MKWFENWRNLPPLSERARIIRFAIAASLAAAIVAIVFNFILAKQM